MTEVRHSFEATLAGRVLELGHPREHDNGPGAFYISGDLSSDEKDRVLFLLKGRSTAKSGGPIAYLPEV
ncbi:hypothetical protein [Rhodococcus sp. APC 3903]|uniref:hypothetical protein n=1 Tax=Rhodococcus sp. APC 3903 TaxID=3035193 RepID=UPI0025B38243|nr:hypothetical protein [Rhodococcus sp. APC 3903]MDN3461131.1 hypothetical protein [Rhodococcus sp. APC 3903]